MTFHTLTMRAARGLALAAGAVLLAIMAVTSLNALAFAAEPLGLPFAGLAGYEDFVSLAIATAALSFMPWCQAQRGHIAIDFLVSLLPSKLERAMDAISLAALIILTLFLAYWLGVGMLEARADNALSPVLGWPRWPFFATGILALFLWAAVCAAQLFKPDTARG